MAKVVQLLNPIEGRELCLLLTEDELAQIVSTLGSLANASPAGQLFHSMAHNGIVEENALYARYKLVNQAGAEVTPNLVPQ